MLLKLQNESHVNRSFKCLKNGNHRSTTIILERTFLNVGSRSCTYETRHKKHKILINSTTLKTHYIEETHLESLKVNDKLKSTISTYYWVKINFFNNKIVPVH